MWQIAWMLSLLPDWFWTLVLIAGIIATLAAWVLKFIPFVRTYRLPIQVGGIIALLVGVYFQGVIANEEKWIKKLEAAEKEKAEIEAKAKEANIKLLAANEETRRVQEAAGAKQAELARKLKDALNKPGATPTTIIQDLSPEERKRYETMNEAQKKEYEQKLAALIENSKTCPTVPQYIVDKINDAAVKAKKGETK
jgi:hypothetical protein